MVQSCFFIFDNLINYRGGDIRIENAMKMCENKDKTDLRGTVRLWSLRSNLM